jgi:hypothetical protein
VNTCDHGHCCYGIYDDQKALPSQPWCHNQSSWDHAGLFWSGKHISSA